MNGMAAGTDTGTLGAIAVGGIYVGLFAFGILFNLAVAWLHKRRPTFPNSILVVFGVLVTLAGGALLQPVTGWHYLIVSLTTFAASGLAMVAGDLWRATELPSAAAQHSREQAEVNMRLAQVTYGNQAATVAPEGE